MLGQQRDLARDAAQETALRFLRDLPSFRGQSSVRTWSIGIAINVTRELRRTYRVRENLAQVPLERAEQPVPPADQNAAILESHSALRAMLESLPVRQREAVVLRFFEGMSVDEAADAMQCAPGTVKATVHQALRSLREKLSQHA
jgi:RNA polymerase sigma-70 factor (ECF subfamily)